jgi:hypothetical protein
MAVGRIEPDLRRMRHGLGLGGAGRAERGEMLAAASMDFSETLLAMASLPKSWPSLITTLSVELQFLSVLRR